MSEIGTVFQFYSWNSQLMAGSDVFFLRIKSLHKTKKNKIEKYVNFKRKMGKLVSNLKMNTTKLGKMLKSKKFMIIFAF